MLNDLPGIIQLKKSWAATCEWLWELGHLTFRLHSSADMPAVDQPHQVNSEHAETWRSHTCAAWEAQEGIKFKRERKARLGSKWRESTMQKQTEKSRWEWDPQEGEKKRKPQEKCPLPSKPTSSNSPGISFYLYKLWLAAATVCVVCGLKLYCFMDAIKLQWLKTAMTLVSWWRRPERWSQVFIWSKDLYSGKRNLFPYLCWEDSAEMDGG